LALSLQVEEKARADGDFYQAAFGVYAQVSIYRARGQAAEVMACVDRAEQHWKQAAEAGARERGMVLELRGHGYYLRGDYPAALAAFREALAIDLAIGTDSADVVSDLTNVANAERGTGERDAADRDFGEALRIAKKLDNRGMIANATGNLAILAADREDWKATEQLAREATRLSEHSGRLETLAHQSALLARALARQGKKADGTPFARRAVEIFTKMGHSNLNWAKEVLRECGG